MRLDMNNSSCVEKLKKAVVQTFGCSLDSPMDYDSLASAIQEKTGTPISSTTLKRVFGYVNADSKPSKATLGILARYCGYAGWEDWCGQQEKEGEKNKGRGKGRIYIISASLLSIIAAIAAIWSISYDSTDRKVPEGPKFTKSDSFEFRYEELMKYCVSQAAEMCDSVRAHKDNMDKDEYFAFANEQYSKILDRMRVLSTKYASEAFEDNDSLRLAYGAMIFNACRETCLPLYMEAYREYYNTVMDAY